MIGGSTRVKNNSEVPDPTSYTVVAHEPRGGVPERWFVVVTAQCAPTRSLLELEHRRSDLTSSASTHHLPRW
ncbi:MAG: hypothetical protein ACR2LI_04340 [Propionibacteriaceae bacterium]